MLAGTGAGHPRPPVADVGEVNGPRAPGEDQGSGHEQRPGRSLHDPKADQRLHARRQAAQDGRASEPDQSDHEEPPAPVCVGKSAGQDQQCAQAQEVGVVDVRLALEDAEVAARQILADALEGDVDDGRVEEDDPGTEDRRQQGAGPAVHDRDPGEAGTAGSGEPARAYSTA